MHPGRGASDGRELLTERKRYLDAVKRLVHAAVAASPQPDAPTDAELATLREAILGAYPDLDYEVFLKLGLPAVWRHDEAR